MVIKIFKHLSVLGLLLANVSCERTTMPHHMTGVRAPAYPLVTIDPYTSVWSMSDQLFDEPTKHWTNKVHSLIGAVRVDGEVFRFLGKESIPLKPMLPMAKDEVWSGNYSFHQPVSGWERSDFDDQSWSHGVAAFGSEGMKAIGTKWEDGEIWVRRTFEFPMTEKKLFLIYSHDDDFELYLNGKEIINTGNSAKHEIVVELDPSIFNTEAKNVFAAHCRDRGGLAYLDFGIYAEADQQEVFSRTGIQRSAKLSATQTEYVFTCGAINLQLTFTAPLLLDDLDLLSRPVNYLDYSVTANDGNPHEVQLYFETTPQWAVDTDDQEVEVSSGVTNSVSFLKTGTTTQQVLEKKGDNVRIDWGYQYLVKDNDDPASLSIEEYFDAKESFVRDGTVRSSKERVVATLNQLMPALIYLRDISVAGNSPVDGYLILGYDDINSIQYFGENLKGWWAQESGVNMESVIDDVAKRHDDIIERCITFDNKLWQEALNVGGIEYAELCVLAYRQSIAAHKLTKDSNGNILFLSKENFSNGSIGTVDVTYPSAPLFLRYNPELLKGMLNPIFYYSESGQWTKPFAAHDVGTYPIANGQTYGGDMPVEESGNMLILTAAIANREGNASYAEQHWAVLSAWADYLLENGLDPENQLCTDDFSGHFAHNTNLSIKAIMGIASYGKLAEMLGKNKIADQYNSAARRMALEWEKMANDGDHYRLTFDKPDTWSQKYNLVWDKILGFNIFPSHIIEKELAFYLSVQNKYGLPLDNRRTYTKSDWIIWTATLTNDQESFVRLIKPVHAYVSQTKDRVPMSDWYETPDASQVGFQARSVVGGYYIKMIAQ